MIKFKNRIVKLKAFKKLNDYYKSDKFITLYYKMYSYMLSIPKEKIISKMILNRNDYIEVLLNYISYFIEAKDFYKWKNRVYSLLTEKINNREFIHYQLLYNSKAKKYFENSIELYKTTWNTKSKKEKEYIKEKRKATNLKIYGCENTFQSPKTLETIQERYGSNITNVFQIEKVKEKSKSTNLEKRGVENAAQSKEVQEKMKATNLAKYGREHVGGWFNLSPYSKFGDEVCTMIDNLLGNPEDSIYYAKSGKEYCIHTDTKNYYVDMIIPSLGLAFEADGCYYHGLLEGQVDVKGTPVEEIHKRDKEKSEAIEKAGYKLFRIREDEYKKDPENYLLNILYPRILEYVNRSSF